MLCRSCAALRASRPSAFSRTAAAASSSSFPMRQSVAARSYSILTRAPAARSAFGGISAARQQPLLPCFTRPTLSPSPSAGPLTLLQLPTATRPFSTSSPLAGPRDTYNMTHKKRKRRLGFLARIKSRTGRKILARRRAKGKQNMSH